MCDLLESESKRKFDLALHSTCEIHLCKYSSTPGNQSHPILCLCLISKPTIRGLARFSQTIKSCVLTSGSNIIVNVIHPRHDQFLPLAEQTI